MTFVLSRSRYCWPTIIRAENTGPGLRDLFGVPFGPRRHDPVYPRIRYQLPHVLIRMNNDSQVHAVDRGVPAIYLNPSLKVAWLYSRVRSVDRIERTFQPVHYF